MKNTVNNFKRVTDWLKNSRYVFIIILVAVVGSFLLLAAKAATSFFSSEVENSTLTNCATKINDNSASNGMAVRFGCGSASKQLVIISPADEMTQIKQAIKSGNKKQYWDYVKSKGYVSDPRTTHIPNWSQNVSYTIDCAGVSTTYNFNPLTYRSVDHANACSVDAQGRYMHNAALNAYTTALRWRLDDDQTNGNHAMALIDSWVNNFQSVEPNIAANTDARDNQLRLNSSWFIASFTKALEIIWDHPDFTVQKKQKTADWLWRVFLKQDPKMYERNNEILGQQQAGWNGRTGYLQGRLNIGLVMKAAGHSRADDVINQVIVDANDVLPEILYYGKQPWHEALGQPWPKQPYRKLSATYNNFHTPNTVKDYWYFSSSASTPPPFFVGQNQETGRDVAHSQFGVGSITELFRSLRLNNYGDRFTQQNLGDVMLGMGEQHANFYNQTLDEFWSGGYSSLDSIKSGVWQPAEWSQLKFKIPYSVSGSGADQGWEFLRTELKRSGYATPQLDRLTLRLRGVSPRNSSNAAGYIPITTANNKAWEPLFALDYQ